MVSNGWLVLWNMNGLWLSIQLGMECHHPDFHSNIFQKGRYTINQVEPRVIWTEAFTIWMRWFKEWGHGETLMLVGWTPGSFVTNVKKQRQWLPWHDSHRSSLEMVAWGWERFFCPIQCPRRKVNHDFIWLVVSSIGLVWGNDGLMMVNDGFLWYHTEVVPPIKQLFGADRGLWIYQTVGSVSWWPLLSRNRTCLSVADESAMIFGVFDVVNPTRWCPTVISWFINPMNTIVICVP